MRNWPGQCISAHSLFCTSSDLSTVALHDRRVKADHSSKALRDLQESLQTIFQFQHPEYNEMIPCSKRNPCRVGDREKKSSGVFSSNDQTLKLAIALNALAACAPIIFGAVGSFESEPSGHAWIPYVFGAISIFTLINAYNGFRAELKYYEANSLDSDSKIEANVTFPGKFTGRKRLFLYYPLIFFGSSAVLGFVILFLKH